MALRFHKFSHQHNCLCCHCGQLGQFCPEEHRAHNESLKSGSISTKLDGLCQNVHWKRHMKQDLHLFLVGKTIFDAQNNIIFLIIRLKPICVLVFDTLSKSKF